MAETELQKSNIASQGAADVQEGKQAQQPAQGKDISQLLSALRQDSMPYAGLCPMRII